MNRYVLIAITLVASAQPVTEPALADSDSSSWNYAQPGLARFNPQYRLDDVDRENPILSAHMSGAIDREYGQIFYGFDHSPTRTSLATAWSDGKLKLGFGGGRQDPGSASLPDFSDDASQRFQAAGANWRQVSLGWKMRNDINLNGAATRINLENRADAMVYQSSVALGNWSGHIAHIQRNNDTLARQIRIGWNSAKSSFSYAEFGDLGNHVLHSLRAAAGAGKNSAAGVGLQWGVSPLTGLDQRRIMFHWVYSPRTRRNHDAALQFENSALEFMKNLIIAGGIVAGAVAIASSSGNADGAEGGFTSARDAAQAALNKVNPASIRENREYGGWVYRAKGDSYSVTPAQTGALDHVSLGPKPDATQASYHTHGAPNRSYDGEHFSASDTRSDNQQGVDGYLGTPLGKFLYYNHSSGQVSQIGNVATQ